MNTTSGFKKGYVFFILLLVVAALCKSLNAPFSAILLQDTGPMTTMALMCFGAVIFGFFVVFFSRKELKTNPVRRLHKKDTPSLLFIVLVEVAGNILFLTGLSMCLASTASLLKCFGLVATSVVAFFLLKERISRRLLIAILLITLGCITISVGGMDSIVASPGVLLVLASCITSGFSYTLKKKVAERNPGLILLISNGSMVVIGLILACIMGEGIPDVSVIIGGITLGLIVFGITSFLYQISARKLGASKCTSVLNFAPFIGAGISFILFQETPTLAFFISFVLLIPGFYLVLVDKEEKKIIDESAEQSPPVEVYHDIRNYLTAVGFLLVVGISGVRIFESVINANAGIEGSVLPGALIAAALVQIVIGCAIIIFRRRDMAGMLMLICGFSTMLLACSPDNPVIMGYIGVMQIIFAAILLLARERKKYLYSILFFLPGLTLILYQFQYNAIVQIVLNSLVCLYAFVLGMGASGLLPRFPLTRLLAEEENTDFAIVGSTICYIIAAVSVLPWMGTYIFGMDLLQLNYIGNFSMACGAMMGIVALLLIFVAKNRFIGAVFLSIAVAFLFSGATTGIMGYMPGVLMFLTGLACLLRKRSYLLLGVMCILYGISFFVSIVIYGETVLLVSQFLMHLITFVIAVYLAVAVFSQSKRLPLF